MLRIMHKSKIHGARVTEANLNYRGSITIDKRFMELANIVENEKVLVVNINTGDRFETYVIEGEYGSGVICLNGAAARLVQCGDSVIIISFGIYDDSELENFKAKLVFIDSNENEVNCIIDENQ
ncbi:aspartate 1-decarboxylase [Alkaliphilus peptidifermentans]|uniref:Aspartate 1-decarboxylase n=1 Tax=Alkaliphilus peptidifermentans DSM 18978 TaxID=1120976 RepID=A0A1G5I4H8_9FIRM|nr:aspartate 1-decarboxylase [Alkaliphilus peptidifermentans]SCY71005.1 L-aspartate 1-decarboxylase [Alkaliphilus peptidifermentans DSM 18978]